MFNKNPALQAIIEKAVQPTLDLRKHDAIGKILEYYPEHNTADIEIYINGGKITKQDVPLPYQSGIVGKRPQSGDEVWVSFHGGNILSPYVVMVYASRYNDKVYNKQIFKAKTEMPVTWGMF